MITSLFVMFSSRCPHTSESRSGFHDMGMMGGETIFVDGRSCDAHWFSDCLPVLLL